MLCHFSCCASYTFTLGSPYLFFSPAAPPSRPFSQNAEKYKHYERWATAKGFPRQNIINDGTTSSTGGIGAIADIDLAIRSRGIDDDLLVVSGDMLFNPKSFDLEGVVQFFKARGGELSCYYTMHPTEDPSTRGILELNRDQQITAFYEKPKPGKQHVRRRTCTTAQKEREGGGAKGKGDVGR